MEIACSITIHLIMSKHAYMIMCHDKLEQLKVLVSLLDDERNDIYIHMDRKTQFSNLDAVSSCVKKAKINWVKRENVNWGGFSQIKAEYNLLNEATKTKHMYYHLISGVDLPIKSQNEIHDFFDANGGMEYISVEKCSNTDFNIFPRIGQFHFFQEKIGRNSNKGMKVRLAGRLELISIKIQNILGIDRTKKLPSIYKGAQWFSITHNMALYLLSREKDIERWFKYGIGVDELFVQTIAMQSPYKNKIENDNKRFIDWNRGQPYTWKSENYEEIINSKKLFARKFSIDEDPKIIEMIKKHVQ